MTRKNVLIIETHTHIRIERQPAEANGRIFELPVTRNPIELHLDGLSKMGIGEKDYVHTSDGLGVCSIE